jgi:hypothetical protein
MNPNAVKCYFEWIIDQSKKEQLAASYLAGQWKALQSLYYRETYERVSSATNQIMAKVSNPTICPFKVVSKMV